MADIPKIPIDLDKSAAKATAAGFAEDMRALNQQLIADAKVAAEKEIALERAKAQAKIAAARGAASERAATDRQALLDYLAANKSATAEEIADAQRKAQVMREIRSNQAEGSIRLSRRQAEEEGLNIRSLKRHVEEVGDEAESTGKKGKSGFGAMGAAAVTFAGGAAVVAYRQLQQITAEFDKVGQKSRELSKQFASDRDKLRELAAVEGKVADDAFTLETHRFAKDSALSFDEAVQFRANFANVAQQFRVRNIDEKEYQQYQALSAAQAARTGASPETAASFAGAFLTQDLRGHKDKAAEEAFRRQFKIASIYDAGEGTATQNFGAFGALSKEFEPGRTPYSAFKSQEELAIVGSIANAAGPDRQREQIQALVRNLRGDDKDVVALRKKAGITSEMGIQAMVEKLAPILTKQAKDQRRGIDQVIGDFLPDRQSREALAIQIEQGVMGGGYAQRAGVAAGAGGEGAGEKSLESFKASPAGQQRVAESDVKLAEAERAAKNSELTVLRRQALARLVREERVDTNDTALNNFMNAKASFGAVGSAEQKQIDTEVQEMLRIRGGGKLAGEKASDVFNLTPEAREKQLRRNLEATKGTGVNPLLEAPAESELIDRRRGLLLKEGEGPRAGTAPGALENLNWLLGAQPKYPKVDAISPLEDGKPRIPREMLASLGFHSPAATPIMAGTGDAAARERAPGEKSPAEKFDEMIRLQAETNRILAQKLPAQPVTTPAPAPLVRPTLAQRR